MGSLSATARYYYLAHLSRPAAHRSIYRLIRRYRLRRLVELGVGVSERSQRMIEVAARGEHASNVFFSGVDLFEARSSKDGPGLPLKQIHRKLAATGAKVRLLPGDPHAALARTVNMLGIADLVVISADQDRASLARAWWFIERLLQDNSHVLIEEPATDGGASAFRAMTRLEVRQLVTPERRRAA